MKTVFIIVLFLVGTASYAHASSVSFSHETQLKSDTGYMALEWQNDENLPVELQQSDNPHFNKAVTLYRGQNHSYFLSGLKDGTYYYRLRTGGEKWSEPVTLSIVHHSIQKAWLLFLLGLFVFAGTVLVIVKGTADEQ